ncbi:DUF4392 domain-containing protein [Halorientalis brevis]|uniref:DUF4392 domain-containing protein n=1 Tax=Halorientalis brevis TaxID=1126241 RepID=A0ABD6CJP0_9EURY|nr:DUF4392 domain-containing protein [Halorientalis brevis]
MFVEIDHQITLDLGGRNSRRLYEAVRADDPLVKTAAERLQRACESGGHVLLTTGFPIVPPGAPETDGPLGTVVLARALARLGATPVLVVEPMVRDPITALADELGCDFPVETVEPTATSADSLLDRYEPTALVAIEKPGRCADGSYRNMAGADILEYVGPVDGLFEQAREQGIPTVAVGDGGNELGMGVVQSTVEAAIPHGETIACVTPVDALVVAGVSNWGAYGIVAALSVFAGENLLHTGEAERRLLARSLSAGCVDGVSGDSETCVDGIACEIHESVVDILHRSCAAELATD